MSDLAMLETSILDQIAAAGDEAALEAVRVAALDKKGSISALLATLGKMSPRWQSESGTEPSGEPPVGADHVQAA